MPFPARKPLKSLTKQSSGNLITDCMRYAREAGLEVHDLGGIPLFIHRGGKKTISMISGLHGNERSGPIFLHNLLRSWSNGEEIPPMTFLIAPLLNDDGWDRKKRTWRGVDLNRIFTSERRHDNPAIKKLMQYIEDHKPILHWDIHEDSRYDHSWIFDYTKDKHDLAKRLANHLRVRVHPWDSLDGKDSKGTSEWFARKLKVPYVITSEATPAWSMDKRLQWLRQIYEYLVTEVYNK